MMIYVYLFLGFFWAMLVQSGLVLGVPKRLVIFRDRLDFLLSALLPVLALTLWVIERGGVRAALVVLMAIVLWAVTRNALAENRRIWIKGLAVVTKLSLVLTMTYLVLNASCFLPRVMDRSQDVFGRSVDAFIVVGDTAILGAVCHYVYRHITRARAVQV